jgi:hypothetical protein
MYQMTGGIGIFAKPMYIPWEKLGRLTYFPLSSCWIPRLKKGFCQIMKTKNPFGPQHSLVVGKWPTVRFFHAASGLMTSLINSLTNTMGGYFAVGLQELGFFVILQIPMKVIHQKFGNSPVPTECYNTVSVFP